MKIEELNPPEVLTDDGITVPLTHKKTSIRIEPSDPDFPIVLTERKGFLRQDGTFRDYGPSVTYTMDGEGFRAFVEATGGDCKLSDLKPAIERRTTEVAATRAAAEAAAKARQDAARQAAQPQPQNQNP